MGRIEHKTKEQKQNRRGGGGGENEKKNKWMMKENIKTGKAVKKKGTKKIKRDRNMGRTQKEDIMTLNKAQPI